MHADRSWHVWLRPPEGDRLTICGKVVPNEFVEFPPYYGFFDKPGDCSRITCKYCLKWAFIETRSKMLQYRAGRDGIIAAAEKVGASLDR